MITILLLGKLSDLAESPICVAAPLDWEGLKAALPPALVDAVEDPRNRIAVNGALLADKTALQAGECDEIALLPPVSGG